MFCRVFTSNLNGNDVIRMFNESFVYQPQLMYMYYMSGLHPSDDFNNSRAFTILLIIKYLRITFEDKIGNFKLYCPYFGAWHFNTVKVALFKNRFSK